MEMTPSVANLLGFAESAKKLVRLGWENKPNAAGMWLNPKNNRWPELEPNPKNACKLTLNGELWTCERMPLFLAAEGCLSQPNIFLLIWLASDCHNVSNTEI